MATWQEIAAAETFLEKKLREYVAQSNVPPSPRCSFATPGPRS